MQLAEAVHASHLRVKPCSGGQGKDQELNRSTRPSRGRGFSFDNHLRRIPELRQLLLKLDHPRFLIRHRRKRRRAGMEQGTPPDVVSRLDEIGVTGDGRRAVCFLRLLHHGKDIRGHISQRLAAAKQAGE